MVKLRSPRFHNRCKGRGEVEDIERLFLADPEVEIVFPGIHLSIIAIEEAFRLFPKGLLAGRLQETSNALSVNEKKSRISEVL